MVLFQTKNLIRGYQYELYPMLCFECFILKLFPSLITITNHHRYEENHPNFSGVFDAFYQYCE